MRQHTAVYLAQVSRKHGILRYELALFELSIDQGDVAILIELCTAQLELIARFDDAPTKPTVLVQEALNGWPVA